MTSQPRMDTSLPRWRQRALGVVFAVALLVGCAPKYYRPVLSEASRHQLAAAVHTAHDAPAWVKARSEIWVPSLQDRPCLQRLYIDGIYFPPGSTENCVHWGDADFHVGGRCLARPLTSNVQEPLFKGGISISKRQTEDILGPILAVRRREFTEVNDRNKATRRRRAAGFRTTTFLLGAGTGALGGWSLHRALNAETDNPYVLALAPRTGSDRPPLSPWAKRQLTSLVTPWSCSLTMSRKSCGRKTASRSAVALRTASSRYAWGSSPMRRQVASRL